MRNAGFTLIELVVVISIIALMTGLSIATYNNFNLEQKLTTDAKKLVDTLDLARKRTLSADLAQNTCDNFNGYSVTVAANAVTTSICCSGSCTAVNSYSFQQGIDAATTASFAFKALTANTTASAIKLRNTSLGKCIPINITANGIITESPKCTCTDPACN